MTTTEKKGKKKSPSPGTETLAYKQSLIRGFVEVIGLNSGRFLTAAERDDIQGLEAELAQNLNALAERSKLEEADIKIDSMRKMLAIIKGLEWDRGANGTKYDGERRTRGPDKE